MPEQQFEPLSSEPGLMSEEKRNWCASLLPRNGAIKQPKFIVLLQAMAVTPRPSAPDESILFGYVTLNKFHDREPEAVLKAIENTSPTFFDDYPRRPNTELNDKFKKAVIGEMARAFCRHGLAAYGKPGLRGPKDLPAAEAPISLM
jgi:hypothetical protein